MSDELFPPDAGSMLSPRLAWMRRYDVITLHLVDRGSWLAGFQSWRPEMRDAEDFFFWETAENAGTRIGEGATEDEALAELLTKGYARERGIKLWNEEGGT